MAANYNLFDDSDPTGSLLDAKSLTYEIFSILENKLLFGHPAAASTGKVRILSIDAAGSTDGVLAANSLLHLQNILRRKSGNPTAHISDFFDVVAGSGVGGILASLLFTPGKNGLPVFTADQALDFVVSNKFSSTSNGNGLFRLCGSSRPNAALRKVFDEITLRDTMKSVLIPCYDLNSGAPFLFSRADALEMDGCDFKMSDVCTATSAPGRRPVELKSIDGRTKILAVGGGVAMSNPTAAAITHVLNNKQEFPLCKGVEDLLVVSLGNGESDFGTAASSPTPSMVRIAGDAAADMVDQAMSMAFGEYKTSNYFRIQGNGILAGKRQTNKKKRSNQLVLSMADEMLGQKNVESVLFQGKKLVQRTNMEKLEILAGDLIKEQERRKNSTLPTVILKRSTCSPRSSSATTLSLSSN